MQIIPRSVLFFICAIQFFLILYILLVRSNDTSCFESLAEANSRIEELSSLQNTRESEYAAEAVAKAEEIQTLKESIYSLKALSNHHDSNRLKSNETIN